MSVVEEEVKEAVMVVVEVVLCVCVCVCLCLCDISVTKLCTFTFLLPNPVHIFSIFSTNSIMSLSRTLQVETIFRLS